MKNGKNEPDFDSYMFLAKLFNCSVEYIAGKSDVRNLEKTNNTNVLKMIGKNIKQIRLQKKITQETLSQKINKSSHYISLIERGEADINLSTIITICEILEVDANAIFTNIIPTNKNQITNLLNNSIILLEKKDEEMLTHLIHYIIDSKNIN